MNEDGDEAKRKISWWAKLSDRALASRHSLENAMKNFFISYNSADCTWAEWIAWQLEERIHVRETC